MDRPRGEGDQQLVGEPVDPLDHLILEEVADAAIDDLAQPLLLDAVDPRVPVESETDPEFVFAREVAQVLDLDDIPGPELLGDDEDVGLDVGILRVVVVGCAVVVIRDVVVPGAVVVVPAAGVVVGRHVVVAAGVVVVVAAATSGRTHDQAQPEDEEEPGNSIHDLERSTWLRLR